jgi:hypothetical protein
LRASDLDQISWLVPDESGATETTYAAAEPCPD